MQHLCAKCQKSLPVVDKTEAEVVTPQQVGLAMDVATLKELSGGLAYTKNILANAIVDTIEAELNPDDLGRKTFRANLRDTNFDAKQDTREELVKHLETIAMQAPRELADVVLRKWLGQTTRERKASLEVLCRLFSDTDHNNWLVAQQAASNMLHYWAFDVGAVARYLTIEDAKKFCAHPLDSDSEGDNETSTSGELSTATERLVGLLAADLKPGESLFPDARQEKLELGDKTYNEGDWYGQITSDEAYFT